MSDERVEARCPFCGHTDWVNLDELDKQSPAVYRGGPAPREYRTGCNKCGRRFVIAVPSKESNDD
jgi:hypothetical protein